jgi:flagellar hook-associated protein 3 FlgL
MRIDPNSVNIMMDAINSTTQAEQQAFQEMASGLRVNKPSDDPAAAAEDVSLTAQLSENDQYLQSISSAQSQLQSADSTLSSIITTLQQAVSLGTEGANGTTNAGDRASIAQQISGILQTVLGLANTSFSGAYLFAGGKTTTQPFVIDPNSASGVSYQGNDDTNTLTVSENSAITTNVPGDQLFMAPGADVFAALNQMVTALNANNTSGVSNAVSALSTALDNVTQQRAFYGNALNELVDDTNYLNSDNVQLQTQQQNAVGADMSQMVTQMTQAENAQTATYQAAAKLLDVSLMDYLHPGE